MRSAQQIIYTQQGIKIDDEELALEQSERLVMMAISLVFTYSGSL